MAKKRDSGFLPSEIWGRALSTIIMLDLTVIIISKNDVDVIGDAIKSVKAFAKEVVVVDGSTDNETEMISQKYGARVIKHPFKNFSDQRNFGILHAATNWVLYLDSDERVTEEFRSELEKTINTYDPYSGIAGYYIYRQAFYYGHDWHFQDRVQRLFFREKFIEWSGLVHETPKVKGEFDDIQSPIIHLTHRNLSQMLKKTNEWSEYEAKLRFDSSHPDLAPWRFLRVMITEFMKSYLTNKGYKNGTYGLIEAMYQSFSIFITYAKLWELQEKAERKV